MKNRIFAGLVLFAVCLCASVLVLKASPSLLVGTLTTINNATNDSSAVTALQYNPTLQQFSCTHSGLASTNALAVDIRMTVLGDATNVVIGTWHPTTTNAGTETFSGSSFSITNSLTVRVRTTNSVDVGVSYGQ